MKEDAQIICRKEPHGVFCEWHGGSVASVSSDTVRKQIKKGQSPIGKIIRVGDLRVRIIELKCELGCYYDTYLVMLAHNPHGELQVLYRSAVRGILRFSLNLEARIHGFMLKPYEGKLMPFTGWLYKHLL